MNQKKTVKRHWLWNLFFKPSVAKMKEQGDVTGLVNALTDENPHLQIEAEDALISLLSDGDVHMRREAVSRLTKISTARSIEALCHALKDDDEVVKRKAAKALEANADIRAVAPLITIAQDTKASVHVQTILRAMLDRNPGKVTTEDLRKAAQMNDSYVLIFAQIGGSCTFTTYNVTSEECDFTQIKQMARQELIRRGLEA